MGTLDPEPLSPKPPTSGFQACRFRIFVAGMFQPACIDCTHEGPISSLMLIPKPHGYKLKSEISVPAMEAFEKVSLQVQTLTCKP